MKKALHYIPCLICVAIAGYMAINGTEGWGWFLFGALVLFPGVGK